MEDAIKAYGELLRFSRVKSCDFSLNYVSLKYGVNPIELKVNYEQNSKERRQRTTYKFLTKNAKKDS